MKLIHSSSNLEYDLFEDDNGSFVISVLCGTIGLYEARIRLSQEEIEQYRQEGIDFLDRLALNIRKEESKFRSRFI